MSLSPDFHTCLGNVSILNSYTICEPGLKAPVICLAIVSLNPLCITACWIASMCVVVDVLSF